MLCPAHPELQIEFEVRDPVIAHNMPMIEERNERERY
jgi:hypothetical protein